MAQWFRNPTLSLERLGLLLWCVFDPWLRNFHLPCVADKGKRTGKRRDSKGGRRGQASRWPSESSPEQGWAPRRSAEGGTKPPKLPTPEVLRDKRAKKTPPLEKEPASGKHS